MKRLLFIGICLLGFILSESFVTQSLTEDEVPPITNPYSTINDDFR